MSHSDSPYYLSPNQQDLLVATLASNQPSTQDEAAGRNEPSRAIVKNEKENEASSRQDAFQDSTNDYLNASPADASPPIGFDLDADGDDQYDFDAPGQFFGDISGETSHNDSNELHEKRKAVGDKDDGDEGGGKRRESEGATGKKPGRKPLTAEPTTKRKAQNRAAQRAFRERKEKHLKDLETKVEDLEKVSEATNHENGLLRAQVERLQVELKEYRKRLSWVSSSGQGGIPFGSNASGAGTRNLFNSNQSDFQFEFPRFGDLTGKPLFNSVPASQKPINDTRRSATLPSNPSIFGIPGVVGRNSVPNSSPTMPAPSYRSTGNSPVNASSVSPPVPSNQTYASESSFESFSGLFSPSILEASRQATSGYFPPTMINTSNPPTAKNSDHSPGTNVRQCSASSGSNSNSPASSYESRPNGSSIGTSPAPSLSSPAQKVTDHGLNTIREENQPQNASGGERSFCEQLSMACGDCKNPVPRIMSTSNGSTYRSGAWVAPVWNQNFNWIAQQNGGGFDPVLFGDYRESQDALASQDFGAFFNDAFPLPELGSPDHNFNDVAPSNDKPDLVAQLEAAQDESEEVVPAEDTSKVMTCNKIWDRLQSMETFRNGEIDIDNLCSDLRSKARCSENGAVVHQTDVDKILGLAQ